MTSIKGTQTEKNLLISFAGESQARNRYTFFAGQAKKDGYVHVAAVFEETAAQEKEHAKRFFKFLEGGDVEVVAMFPAGIIGTTAENLKAAADGEHEEWSEAYPKFAEIARQEGFLEISQAWTAISIAEKQHEKRYRAFLKAVEEGTMFKRTGVTWRCRNCGFVVTADTALEHCPACVHPQSYFEILAENW
ncbi:MAG: rubrerythrin family protein [Planctomycetaceae bacterium]|nr:rubrerythrin family protein [Planctomycetaceae bacterium]